MLKGSAYSTSSTFIFCMQQSLLLALTDRLSLMTTMFLFLRIQSAFAPNETMAELNTGSV